MVIPAVALALGVPFWRVPAEADAQDDPAATLPRVGHLIRIDLPITIDDTVKRVERFVRRAMAKTPKDAQLYLVFEFKILPDQDEFAKDTEFNAAWALADFLSGEELSRGNTRTVAYVPQSLPGQAVLVALACDQIIMAADAELGPVGAKPEGIGSRQRLVYTDIADRPRTVPAEVALWLLDPSHEVWVIDHGRKFVGKAGLKELEDRREPITSKGRLFDAADPEQSFTQQRGLLTGEEARRLGIVKYLAGSRQDLAKALDLPPEAMQEDFSLTGRWRAAWIELDGPISPKSVREAQNMLEQKIELGETNLVVVSITSEGGSLDESIAMAVFLEGLDRAKIRRTVAYVPSHARAGAALVALACDQVVVHATAELGGAGEPGLSREDIELARQSIRDPNGPWAARSWSLVAAMIDPDLEVFHCTQPGQEGYFCEEELEELRQKDPDGRNWQKGMPVTRARRPLLAEGDRAIEYGLADRTVDSFDEFKQRYGLPDDLRPLEPVWVDLVINALASPGVSAVLLMIAFVALYAELHAPGIGIGAFVATVCFLLFFWSHYLNKTATELEIILFLGGIACLVLELFVLPGFGIFGLGGGCLVLISLILASQTFVIPRGESQFREFQRSLLTIVGAGAGIVVAAVVVRRWLPRAPILSRMILAPPEGEEAEDLSRRESLVNLDDFVGTRGVTTTQLTPSGKARFDDMLLDVITDGDVIRRDTKIEVVEVYGNRVIVKAV